MPSPISFAAVCAVCAGVCATGCGIGSARSTPEPSAGPASDAVRQYLRLAVALGERDPDSLDYYFGPEDWVADVRAKPPSLSEIRRSALTLAASLAPAQGASPQTRFLDRQLRAIAARVGVLTGAGGSFDQESRALFGFTLPQERDDPTLRSARNEIGQLLPGAGPLARRYAAFDAKFLIPPARLPAVMSRALEACRAETRKHLDLPAGESIEVEYVANQPWDAYSRYRGGFHSVIRVNLDFPLTVDRVVDLACHEGYPGHHAYNSLVEAGRVRREGRQEFMVQPTFSPQSFASEAAASAAGEVAFPPEKRLALERDTLFPLAGLDPKQAGLYLEVARKLDRLGPSEAFIARDYLDGKREFLRAGAALEEQALMAQPEATLKYINEYRTYMLAYTAGKQQVMQCLERAGSDAAQAWRAYREMMEAQDLPENCRP